jgi:hypothetical protein
MLEEGHRLRKELLIRKEPGFDEMRKSQAIHIAKDIQIRGFAIRKGPLEMKSRV